jgi:hypothetical protein
LELKLPDVKKALGTKVVYLNVRSLCSNFEYVRTDERLLAADLLILAESRIPAAEHDRFQLPSHPYCNHSEDMRPGKQSVVVLFSVLIFLLIVLFAIYEHHATSEVNETMST